MTAPGTQRTPPGATAPSGLQLDERRSARRKLAPGGPDALPLWGQWVITMPGDG